MKKKTENLYNYEDILSSNLQLGCLTKNSIDNCITSEAVAILLADRRIAEGLADMKNKCVM